MLYWWLSGKELASQCRRSGFDPWVGKIPWRKKWQPTPEFLPGEFHGQRSLVGCSPWDPTELDMSEQLTFSMYYCCHSVPDVQAGFRKDRGTRDQIANIRWIIEKAREFQKSIYFCFFDYT